MWAQCDVMYATLLLFSLEGALRSRPWFTMIAFSISFAMKLQAVFFAPALVAIFLVKRWPLRWFLLTPAAYVVFSIPPLLLGRSAKSLATIYVSQYGYFDKVTMNAASIYQWLPNTPQASAQSLGGIFFAASVCAVSIYVIVRIGSRPFANEDFLAIALFLTLLAPFLLPRMHERYFMASDLFACVVPFVIPSLTIPVLFVVGASFLSYGPHMGMKWLPVAYASFLNLIGLVLILRHLSRRRGIGAVFASPSPDSSQSLGDRRPADP
jgi:Gpi18-like mannosyltransferase